MLPKKHRLQLPPKPELKLIINRKTRTKNFTILITNQSQSSKKNFSLACFAVSVPKHLDKRATRRNRTKRLIYEAIKQLLPKIKPSSKVVIVANRIFWQEKLQDVLPEIKNLFKKADLIQ